MRWAATHPVLAGRHDLNDAAECVRNHPVIPSRPMTLDCLGRARKPGDIDPDTDIAILNDAPFEPLELRLLLGAAPLAHSSKRFDDTSIPRQRVARATMSFGSDPAAAG